MTPNDTDSESGVEGNDTDDGGHGAFVFGEDRRNQRGGEREPAADDREGGWLAPIAGIDRGVLTAVVTLALVLALVLGYVVLPAVTGVASEGTNADQPASANATATERATTPTATPAPERTTAATATATTTGTATVETARTGTTRPAAEASTAADTASTSSATPANAATPTTRTTTEAIDDAETRAAEAPPAIETFRVERRDDADDPDGAGNATIEAVWTVTDPDGDLERVELTLVAVDDDGGTRVVDERSLAVRGSKRHAHPAFSVHKSADAYEVRIEVTDAAGNEVTSVERLDLDRPASN